MRTPQPSSTQALSLSPLAAALAVALLAGCNEPTRPEHSVMRAPAERVAPGTAHGGLTASSFTGWQQIPSGVFNAGPAVISRGVNSVELFGRGLDNAIYYNYWSNLTGYLGWTSLSGVFTSKPAATPWRPVSSTRTCIAVVGKGTDNAIWINIATCPSGHGRFLGWRRIPGATLASAPAVAFAGSKLYVFARKSDNMIYWTSNDVSGAGSDGSGFNFNNWTAWQAIPAGALNSEPAAATVAGAIHVVAKGLDNRFYRNKRAGSGWSGWSPIQNGTFKSGAAISSPPFSCHMDVFGRGMDDAVWMSTSEDCGSSWSGWSSLGGVITSSPAAASWGSGRIDLVVKGADNTFYRNIDP